MSILVIIYKDIIVISNFKSNECFKRENVCVNRTTIFKITETVRKIEKPPNAQT